MLTKNLYSIEYKDEFKAIIKLCDENHPIFKAHFPTNPIMPGFTNFEIISEVFGEKINSIKKAKFLKLIKPNQTLTYNKNKNNYKVSCEDEIVASITL
jgi:3-hydroxyacyl-[acyl-carrier-protein] dehydratase